MEFYQNLCLFDQRVIKVIVGQLGVNPEDVKPESSFTDDLGADSLDSVELVMAFEEEFNINITDAETGKIAKVQDVYDCIRAHFN